MLSATRRRSSFDTACRPRQHGAAARRSAANAGIATFTAEGDAARVAVLKKEVGGRLKQDLDKDLQLHRILILLY